MTQLVFFESVLQKFQQIVHKIVYRMFLCLQYQDAENNLNVHQ